MTRTLLSAALASLLAVGCGRAALDAQPTTLANTAKAKTSSDAAATSPEKGASDEISGKSSPTDAAESLLAASPLRQPGDYVAYRFTGSFQKKPVTLTQRVVAREGDALLVEMTLSAEGRDESLRVRMSDAPATRGEVLGVLRVDASGAEQPASLAAYEALMARTMVAADVNEAELGTESLNLDVGGKPLACQRTSYRVRIGGKTATMHTVQSERFPWGDVGGEITAEDGSVIYRAEVIDAGHTRSSRTSTAIASDEDYEN